MVFYYFLRTQDTDHDPLTHLWNRLVFYEDCRKQKNAITAIASVDMNGLKRSNDDLGHEAGDRALRLMGEILQENGEGCLCCRLGGDEFLFFMKNVTREETEEKVRKIIGAFNEKKNADPGISAASLSVTALALSESLRRGSVLRQAKKAAISTPPPIMAVTE